MKNNNLPNLQRDLDESQKSGYILPNNKTSKQKLSELSIADLLGLESKFLIAYQEYKLNEFRDNLESIQNVLSSKINNIDWDN